MKFWQVMEHGHGYMSTVTTDRYSDIMEMFEDFLYGGEAEVGDKFIVERVSGSAPASVRMENAQGVQIGPNGVQNNVFTETRVTQNVQAGRDAHVSAGSQTHVRFPPGFPFS